MVICQNITIGGDDKAGAGGCGSGLKSPDIRCNRGGDTNGRIDIDGINLCSGQFFAGIDLDGFNLDHFPDSLYHDRQLLCLVCFGFFLICIMVYKNGTTGTKSDS